MSRIENKNTINRDVTVELAVSYLPDLATGFLDAFSLVIQGGGVVAGEGNRIADPRHIRPA